MNNAIDFSDEVSQIQTDCPYIKNADYILNRLIESIKENNKAIPFGNKSRSFDFDSDNSKLINSFKVNAARKSKVDDNTAKMQSIKQLGV